MSTRYRRYQTIRPGTYMIYKRDVKYYQKTNAKMTDFNSDVDRKTTC